MSDEVRNRIAEQIGSNPVMIYIKGTPDFPQCGFSAQVARIFQSMNVPFGSVDVLSEEGFRDGIKQFSRWPTLPQVFIGGEFVGGCDITTELYQSGELQKMVDQALARKGS